MGVGAWVDQDCATRVAKILGGPCVLNLSFPEQSAQDQVMRKDFHHWLQALKTVPITATVSAGAVEWHARHGKRSENVVECLAVEAVASDTASGGAEEVAFDLPDVSDLDHTKAVLKGIRAGQIVQAYILSRLPIDQLAATLRIGLSPGGVSKVSVVQESMRGVFLAHKWLRVLSGRGAGVRWNKHVLAPPLRQLLEVSLSFNWNLPTPSGSTARLGRATTAHRQPIAEEKQPPMPSMALTAEACDANADLDEGANAAGGAGGALFGANAVGGLFGANTGGGVFGCAMTNSGGGLFGAALAPSVSGKGGFGGGSSASGGLFGGPSASKGGGGFFGKAAPPLSGPVTPKQLLKVSGCLSTQTASTSEDVYVGVQACLQRIRFLVQQLASGPTTSGVAALPVREDPLVSQLLGSSTVTSAASSVVHAGFVCDACKAMPITGPRFKSLTAADVDLCQACFASAALVSQHSWARVATPLDLARHCLKTAMCWWPLLPSSADLPEGAKKVDLDQASPAALMMLAQQIFGGAAQ